MSAVRIPCMRMDLALRSIHIGRLDKVFGVHEADQAGSKRTVVYLKMHSADRLPVKMDQTQRVGVCSNCIKFFCHELADQLAKAEAGWPE